MAGVIFILLNLLIYVAIMISLLMWASFLWHLFRGHDPRFDPRVEYVPRRQPFWSVAEFLVMFGTYLFSGAVLGSWFLARGWIIKPQPAPPADELALPAGPEAMDAAGVADPQSLYLTLAISISAGLIAFFVTIVFLMLTKGDRRTLVAELGLRFDSLGVKQGLVGALWYLPPVAIISLMVSWFVPYEHAVLDTLQVLTEESMPLGFLALFLATGLITPWVEEFMFRVLLQGGLQGMLDRSPSQSLTSEVRKGISWLPVILTSVLFALMHVGQGAAPIPLFFLSMGLGYLYRQTGSIVPPLVVHAVLNCTTLVVQFTRLLAM